MKVRNKKNAALQNDGIETTAVSKNAKTNRLRPNLRSALKAKDENANKASLRRCSVVLNRIDTPSRVRKNVSGGTVDDSNGSGEKSLTSTAANNAPGKENIYLFDEFSESVLAPNHGMDDTDMQHWIRRMCEEKKFTLKRHRRIGGIKQTKPAEPRKKRERKVTQTKTVATTAPKQPPLPMKLPIPVNDSVKAAQKQLTIKNQPTSEPLLTTRRKQVPLKETINLPLANAVTTGCQSENIIPNIANVGSRKSVRGRDTAGENLPPQTSFDNLESSPFTNRVAVRLTRRRFDSHESASNEQRPVATSTADASNVTKRKKIKEPAGQSTPLFKKSRANSTLANKVRAPTIQSFIRNEASLASIYDDPVPSTSSGITHLPSPLAVQSSKKTKSVSFNISDDDDELAPVINFEPAHAIHENEQHATDLASISDIFADMDEDIENCTANRSPFRKNSSPILLNEPTQKRDYTRSPLKSITNLNSLSGGKQASRLSMNNSLFLVPLNRESSVQSSPLSTTWRNSMQLDNESVVDNFNDIQFDTVVDEAPKDAQKQSKTKARSRGDQSMAKEPAEDISARNDNVGANFDNLFGFDEDIIEEDQLSIESDKENVKQKKQSKLIRIKMDALCKKKSVLKRIEQLNKAEPLLTTPIMTKIGKSPKKIVKASSTHKKQSTKTANVFGIGEKVQKDIRAAFEAKSAQCATNSDPCKGTVARDPSPLIFRDLEMDRRKSYNGPRQYRKRNASYNSVESDANDSEIDEIETGGNVGRKKKRPTKKKKLIDPDENNDEIELNKYCEDFNAMCAEVDQFEMHQERS